MVAMVNASAIASVLSRHIGCAKGQDKVQSTGCLAWATRRMQLHGKPSTAKHSPFKVSAEAHLRSQGLLQPANDATLADRVVRATTVTARLQRQEPDSH
jgi:hypothetical protein